MRIVLLFTVLFLFNLQAFAGKIAGKVSDEKTGEPVIGATVVIRSSNIGTATDIDGNFTLTIEPGTHTLEVKYIGYQSKEISEVVVTDGEATVLNIVIAEASSTQLNEVVVRSSLKKENITALYTMQKNSISVSSGISADLIQRSPDRNTGEVLKRVSGASIQNGKFVVIRGLSERYNAAMINGAQMQSTEPDKKAFSFDVIPSNLIDNIIISKTASADLPGDFAGGIVQVLTKDVPDNNFFNVGLTLGYNNQSTFREFISNQRTGGNYIGLRNRDEELPTTFSNYGKVTHGETKSKIARLLENNYPETKSTALPNSSIHLSLGDARRFNNGAKLGTVIGLAHRNDYRILPQYTRGIWLDDGSVNNSSEETSYRHNSSLAALANFSYVTGRNKVSFRNLFNTIHDNNYYKREGYSVSGSQQFKLNSSVPFDRAIYSGQLEGDHVFGGKEIKLNWNLNYSALQSNQQDLRTSYYGRSGSLDETDKFVGNESDPYTLVDRNSRRFFINLKDNSYGGNTFVLLPFEMFGQKQSVKAGYLGVYKTRAFNARIFQYKADVNFNTQTPSEQMFSPDNIGEGKLELEEITRRTDAYEAKSFLNAGFVMFDNHISDKLRLSWGARFESYSQNLKAVNLSLQDIDKTDVFNDFLPSLNLSYSPNEETKIRISGSRTVNRPEFREIAPFMFVDYESNWQITGNPDLKRANITNVDLRYEYYPAPGEAVTVGAFYKHFENPIENMMDGQSNPDLLIFGFQNAPSAQAIGAELDLRKNLSFISGSSIFRDLTLGANLTYTHSTVELDSAIFGSSKSRPLQGQSPYLINFSLLYSNAKTGLGISALYNRVGERIYVVGNGTIPTTWEKSRNVFDIQVSKTVLKHRGELKLTVSDILNQPYLFYWNYDDKNTYDSGSDRVFQKYTYGTSFNLGFTYRLGK